jgi:arylsulfatase A-like enzyme
MCIHQKRVKLPAGGFGYLLSVSLYFSTTSSAGLAHFMKMHNPTNPDPAFRGKSKLGNYSDSMLELDANIGRVMDAIRAEAPNTIVIITADNGAWQMLGRMPE